MLPYDLCRQLKEAGFPQPGGLSDRLVGPPDSTEEQIKFRKGNFYYSPTIQDLIRELGDKFTLLCRASKGFGDMAGKWGCHGSELDPLTYGDTPEEALARLYLATHSHP